MKLTIRETQYVEHDTNFEFPMYRSETINEDETVYWKFANKHSVTRIVDKMSEMRVLHYDHEGDDLIRDFITSENMLFGRYQYSIISEKFWDSVVERLINLVAKA